MKLSKLAIALYVGLVFASGAVIGVFGDRLYNVSIVRARTPKPDEFRKNYLNMMQTRLGLSPDQVNKLGGIMDETRVRYDELHRKMQPEREIVRKEQQDKVRSILSPDQRAEYDKMLEERMKQPKQPGGHPGPGI